MKKFERMLRIARNDVQELKAAEKSYGVSWRKRGGMGAFMMLARKWDRIENQVKPENYDIFSSYEKDKRQEGLSFPLMKKINDKKDYWMIFKTFVVIYCWLKSI